MILACNHVRLSDGAAGFCGCLLCSFSFKAWLWLHRAQGYLMALTSQEISKILHHTALEETWRHEAPFSIRVCYLSILVPSWAQRANFHAMYRKKIWHAGWIPSKRRCQPKLLFTPRAARLGHGTVGSWMLVEVAWYSCFHPSWFALVGDECHLYHLPAGDSNAVWCHGLWFLFSSVSLSLAPSPSCFRLQNFFAKPCCDVTPLTAQSSRVLPCACAIECVTLWTERTGNTTGLHIVAMFRLHWGAARLYAAHTKMHARTQDKMFLKSGP